MAHPLIERMVPSGAQSAAADEPARALAAPTPSFADVYQEHFDFVWRSARRLGIGAGAIEDFVQEVFVVVHRQLARFEGRSTLRTWLYGIVLRAVREHRRVTRRADARRAPAPAGGCDSSVDTAALPDEQLALSQAARILEQVLDEMAPERREVFVMAELEQMSIPEIAALTGDKINTVYSRLRLAREDFERSVVRRHARDAWRVR